MNGCASPTLAELRGRVQKARHDEIGNWLARRFARPLAVYGTWLAVRLGLSANAVTAMAMAANLGAAAAIGGGGRWGFVIGAALAHLAFWLDHVDGQVARWRGTSRLDGVYLDYLMHHVANLSLGFGLGHGLAVRTGDLRWSTAGFAIATGWALLSLHNDCRYKAFFQRLKRETTRYTVLGGSVERPTRPASWPRGGRGRITWPLFKACEPHVVLIGLTVLAVLAAVSPLGWEWGWRGAVVGMAVLSPALAIGRIVRTAKRGTVEADFGRWFRPASSVALDGPDVGLSDDLN